MRTGDGSITWRRKPWKLPGPELPASTNVVVPLSRRDLGGVDPERGAAPIDMGVQVDQAGHDDLAGDIDDLRRRRRGSIAADRGDLAVRESDVGDLVAPVRRIDDAAAL